MSYVLIVLHERWSLLVMANELVAAPLLLRRALFLLVFGFVSFFVCHRDFIR